MRLYRHRDGKAYLLLHEAVHSETLEQVAVYQGLYKQGSIWCRPLDMFMEVGRFIPIHICDLTPDELTALQKITTCTYTDIE